MAIYESREAHETSAEGIATGVANWLTPGIDWDEIKTQEDLYDWLDTAQKEYITMELLGYGTKHLYNILANSPELGEPTSKNMALYEHYRVREGGGEPDIQALVRSALHVRIEERVCKEAFKEAERLGKRLQRNE